MIQTSPRAGWTLERLDAVCQIGPPRPDIKRANEILTPYLPLSGVDAESGQLLHYEMRSYEEVRRYRCFLEGDVLLARISPSLENGKCVVVPGVPNRVGFGSSEWIVLRPGGRVSAEWLHAFLRRRQFRLQARAFMLGSIGGGYLRLQPNVLAGLKIPVPPSIELQHRILTRMEALRSDIHQARRLAERIRSQSEQMMKAVRYQVFGSLEGVPQALASSSIVVGRAVPRVDDGAGMPIITAEHVRRPESRYRYYDGPAGSRKVVENGALLITRTGPPTVRLWKGSTVALDTSIIAVVPQREAFDAEYLYHALIYYADRGHLVGGVTAAKLRELTLPSPPLEEQMRIANYLDSLRQDVEAVAQENQEAAQRLSILEEGILEQAFRGEL